MRLAARARLHAVLMHARPRDERWRDVAGARCGAADDCIIRRRRATSSQNDVIAVDEERDEAEGTGGDAAAVRRLPRAIGRDTRRPYGWSWQL